MADTLFFLQLKDSKGKFITGESTVSGYEGQIELHSFSWGMSAGKSPTRDDKVQGQTQYQEVELTKFYDRASPGLAQAMLGKAPGSSTPLPFQTALVSVVDMVFGTAKTSGIAYLEIKLEDGFVESLKLAVSGTGAMEVKETVVLSFRTVKLTYYQATKDRATRGSGFSFEGETASLA